MAHLRRVALAVLLLAAILGGDVPGVAGRLADFSHRTRDQVWVGHGHQVARVRITGGVSATLAPGVSSPVQVHLLNPNPGTVSLWRVRVSIARVTAPGADAAHPCTAADFKVRQMQRGVLRLPSRRFVDLTALGVPVQGWPQLTMRNRPVNQDGCQGASLTLRFRARRVVEWWAP